MTTPVETPSPVETPGPVEAPGPAGPVVELLGIRHHGPGSARSVAAALRELQPDAVLIEGPSDAGPLLALAARDGMVPPVALLAYVVDEPAISAFWPFAVFSPEWQALTWALAHDVPVRFCDLPAATVLAGRADPAEQGPERSAVRADPLGTLSAAAGYDDPERWWDDVIESRTDATDRIDDAATDGVEGAERAEPAGRSPFPAITEAMTELRRAAEQDHPESPGRRLREDRREAFMRTQLRAVLADGAQRVAVVCGAWHTPALTAPLPSATADAKVLRGTAKRKVALTWVPWTHSRLSADSGYGAGITSPGWYHHLFSHPDLTVTRWLTKVARVLRAEDLPVSSANVIEAVRLAETLAGLRGRQRAGLDEVTEATRAVLVDGDDVALALVTTRLVVGEALGQVPDGTPIVPLEADLRAQARRLRLKFEAEPRSLDLDLRKPTDRARSRLLHRLTVLDVLWAEPARSAVQATGTFRESWRLQWQPELSVGLIEAAMWGSTVEAGAVARLRDTAGSAGAGLPELTAAVEACLLADLPAALSELLAALNDRAAIDLDLEHLTAALPALVRALRYGDVRGTDTGALAGVADAVLTRVCVGLPTAVTSLDDAGAAALRAGLDLVHAAVSLLDDLPPGDARERWLSALEAVIQRSDVHGLLIGRLVRILRDAGRLDADDASRRLSRALSIGATPAGQAAWVEGFFSGGGLLLVHDRDLLGLLDDWIVTLDEQDFVDVLPLLRRTFGQFDPGERRSIGERVRHTGRSGSRAGAAPTAGPGFDEQRAQPAIDTVAGLLGVRP